VLWAIGSFTQPSPRAAAKAKNFVGADLSLERIEVCRVSFVEAKQRNVIAERRCSLPKNLDSVLSFDSLVVEMDILAGYVQQIIYILLAKPQCLHHSNFGAMLSGHCEPTSRTE
jgi:hypothetical protein